MSGRTQKHMLMMQSIHVWRADSETGW